MFHSVFHFCHSSCFNCQFIFHMWHAYIIEDLLMFWAGNRLSTQHSNGTNIGLLQTTRKWKCNLMFCVPLCSHPVQLLGGQRRLQPVQERRPEVRLCVVPQAQGVCVQGPVHLRPAGGRWSLQHRVPRPSNHRREWLLLSSLCAELWTGKVH